ncbi:MAG: pyrrolo-quinoline quinone, partial [bacterium]
MTRSITRFAIAAALSIGLASAAGAVNVTTYHNDNNRTGWDSAETALTQANVATTSFKMLVATVLDEQVDAQPLLVQGQAISGQGTHDVVYVATEKNSVYALDATTGAVLLSVNFGAPIPYTMLPGQCSNNGPNVGIDSTPVIDLASHTLYAITDTLESGHEVFRIHALDMSTLADKVPSVVVTATGNLTNNSN